MKDSHPPESLTVKKIKGHSIVFVDGVVQSIIPTPEQHYWSHCVPDPREFTPHRTLILGFGVGSIASLIQDRWPTAEIMGVDNSVEMWDKSRTLSRLNFKYIVNLVSDAFEFVKQPSIDVDTFDLIVVDLAKGFWAPFYVVEKSFMDRLKARLNPGGRIYVNTPNYDFLSEGNFTDMEKVGSNVVYRYDDLG